MNGKLRRMETQSDIPREVLRGSDKDIHSFPTLLLCFNH